MKTINILYLEDSQFDAELVSHILRKGGINFDMLLVDTQAEYVKALRDWPVDVILADHSMFQFNSFEALKIFKTMNLDIPFILITGTVSEEFAVSILREGADDYLLKDNLARLPSALVNALEKYRLEREQKRHLAELKAHEALMREAEQVAKFGSWEHDFVSGKHIWSAGSYYMYGYLPGEVEPSFGAFLERVHPDDQDAVEGLSDQLGREVDSAQLEYRIVDGKGGVKYVHTRVEVRRNAEGVPVRIVGVDLDVSEKVASQKQLEANERRFRALVENGADAVVILSPEAAIQYASPTFKRVLGYDEHEAVTYSLADLLHPDDLGAVKERLQASLSKPGEPMAGCTARVRHKDGRWRWVQSVITNMLHEPSIGGIVDNFRDVTRQREEHQHLKLLESVITNATEAVMISEAEPQNGEMRRILYVNDAFTGMTGYAAEEAVGQSPLILHGAKTDQEQVARLADAVRRLESCEVELLHYKKNGEDFWSSVLVSPVFDDRDTPTHWISLLRDVSERKRAELSLLMKSRLLGGVAEMISTLLKEASWVKALDVAFSIALEAVAVDRVYYFESYYDPVTGEGFVSQRYERTIENSEAQIDNPDLQNAPFSVYGEMLRPLERGEPFRVITSQLPECAIKNALMEQYIKSVLILPMFVHGRFHGFVGFDDCENEREWSDDEFAFLSSLVSNLAAATEKREATVQLASALAERDTILESIGDGFYSADRNWMVTYWNRAAESLVGVRKGDIVGKNLWDVFPLDLYPVSEQGYRKAMEERVPCQFEDYYAQLDRWFDISAYPSQVGITVFFKDITERKRQEEKLKQLHDELEQHLKVLAASNAELEQFAYVASHDLQEPLRMISSFLVQLEKKYGNMLDERGKKYIFFAVDGAKRMRQIILDLLEYSRVSRSQDETEEVSLNELVDEIGILYRKQIQETKAKFRRADLPVVRAPKSPVRQIFQNLISNSLKYHRPGVPPEISVDVLETRTHWQFSVSDNGIGIAPEFFDKIFVIFQRLHNKDEYSGTGMGLAVTKKVVEKLNGNIWLDSEPGKGSTFYFTVLKTGRP